MELLNRLFYTFIGATAFLYFVLKVALSYWKNRGILHEKPKMPWGHLKGVGRKRHLTESLQALYQKYKAQAPFIGFFAWLRPMLLVLDLESINNILNKDAKHFQDRGLYFNLTDDPLTQNLLQTDGSEWRNLNVKSKALHQAERVTKMLTTGLFKVQQIFEKSLQEQLNEPEFVYNVSELVEGFNVDVISSLAFSLEGDSLRYKDTLFRSMCKNYTQQNNNIYKAYFAFCYPRLARLLQYRLYSPEATNYFQELINGKLYEREYLRCQQQSYDFLQICCEYRKTCTKSNQSFRKLENAEIAAQSFSFIPAGLESCTTTVTCCLYELALQPEIQQRARKEIYAVLRKYQNKLNEDALNEMVYLKQVLCETLRKHSPYPCLLRLTTKDYELPNSIFMLKKGNHLIIPTAAIHNDASYYEHPEKFYPDHFHSTKVQSRPLCAFLPFGSGPRSCVVQHFVQQQMLVCLATLLNRYSFAPCQETVIPLTYDNSKILRKPKTDVKLMLKKL